MLKKKQAFWRMSEPVNLTIVGGGAMGSFIASKLALFARVTMVTHWPEQINAVRQQGLNCIHPDGTITNCTFPVTNDLRELEPVHMALVLVKSYQTSRAAFELAPVLAADGLAVTLQNGLGNYEILEAALGRGRVVQGVTAQGATMQAPGEVRHAGHGKTHFAMTARRREQLSALTDLFNKAGLPAETNEDVLGLQWGKLAINAGINPLTALLRVRNGQLLENERSKRVMCAAAEEAAGVASQLNIALPCADTSQCVIEVAQATAENQSSMLQDVLRGAATEIDAISGAVASRGQAAGISTPVNEALWRKVRAINEPLKPSSHSNKDLLLEELEKLINELENDDSKRFN